MDETPVKRCRGRPKIYKTEEEKQQAIRLQNREACRRFYKKRKEAMLKLKQMEQTNQ